MAYATVADMIARFGELEVLQLTDRNQEGVIDKAVAKTALDDATAEIDAYLGRFKRQVGKVPPLLVRLCCDIARYRLTAAQGVLITEEIRNRYKIDVLEILKALASGDIQLGIDDAGEEVKAENTVIFVNGKNRIFARDNKD